MIFLYFLIHFLHIVVSQTNNVELWSNNGSVYAENFCFVEERINSFGTPCLRCNIPASVNFYENLQIIGDPSDFRRMCLVLGCPNIEKCLFFTRKNMKTIKKLFSNSLSNSYQVLFLDSIDGALTYLNYSMIEHIVDESENSLTDFIIGLRNRTDRTKLILDKDLGMNLKIRDFQVHLECSIDEIKWIGATRSLLQENSVLPDYIQCGDSSIENQTQSFISIESTTIKKIHLTSETIRQMTIESTWKWLILVLLGLLFSSICCCFYGFCKRKQNENLPRRLSFTFTNVGSTPSRDENFH